MSENLTINKATLDYRAALKAAAAAAEQAERLEVNVSIALVARSGQPLVQLSLNDAPPQTALLALRKARTSAGFKVPSNFFRDNNSDDVHLLAALDTHPDLLMLGGGMPIMHNGECIGAVGVSGASQEQDVACAEAALAALGLRAG